MLESPGCKFEALLKVIRALTPTSYMGRAAAKRAFANAPSLIMRNVDAETAAKAKSRLERVGATANFRLGAR